MKITDVTVACHTWPIPKPISNGKYTYTQNVFNLVQVHTDEGITGVGWGGGGTAAPARSAKPSSTISNWP